MTLTVSCLGAEHCACFYWASLPAVHPVKQRQTASQKGKRGERQVRTHRPHIIRICSSPLPQLLFTIQHLKLCNKFKIKTCYCYCVIVIDLVFVPSSFLLCPNATFCALIFFPSSSLKTLTMRYELWEWETKQSPITQ